MTEATDHLEGLSADLVQLERTGRSGGDTAPVVDAMFRHAHSVKGMAGSMEFEGIASLAHRTEDLIDVLRRRPGPVDAETVDALLVAVDALQAMVKAAASMSIPPPDPRVVERVAGATARLRRRPEAAAPPALPPHEPTPTPAPAPARRRYAVEVQIAAGCVVPAVRGFLVLKKLAGLGVVSSAAPGPEDLKAGRIPGKKLSAVVETPETAQAVERALAQISDLAAVAIRTVEEEAAAPRQEAPAPAAEAARTVRVRTEILDYFLDAVGELILATARLREVGRQLPADHRPALDDGVDRLHAIVKDLHDKVMTVRMTPLSGVTDRLPRAARDLARKTGKQVDLEVRGADIEIDRAVLDELADPLLHVLRNAVDHGIEPPHLRQLAGKPAAGRIEVAARRERDRVILEIADDGRGMDPSRLRAAAVARGALKPEQAEALSDREALLLACLPGVSTAQTVTDVSGRGVGMDAVKRAVEAMGGTIEIESAPGAGTRFTFRLPLTVAVQPVLLVRVGDEVLALPIAKVHGAAQVDLGRLETSRGSPVLGYGGGHVPVHELGPLLGIPADPARSVRSVVVAEAESGRIGLAVDALLGQQEAVLKPLHSPLDRVPGLSAVTVLGNGRPVFILDVPRLLAA